MTKENFNIHHKINERAINKLFADQALAQQLFDDTHGNFSEVEMDFDEYQKLWNEKMGEVYAYNRTVFNMMDWLIKPVDCAFEDGEII